VGSNPTPSARINNLGENERRANRANDAYKSGSLRHKIRHSLFAPRSTSDVNRRRSQGRVFIPTRDSAKWVGVFLDAYRAIGVEPLYVVDARSTDGTLELLRAKGATCANFTPSGDFAEAGMIEFGAHAAGGGWLLRLDDDEFPTRALMQWTEIVGAKSLNQAWQVSRRELFRDESGTIVYSRAPTRCPSPYRPEFLHPQPRFFHADRVRWLEQVHTVGYENPLFFDFVPEQAFIIHCNCLLRTPAERLDKILRYEAILPGSALKLADEYLPEIFPAPYHNAAGDGLEEFARLFEALPIVTCAALNRLFAEAERHRRLLADAPRLAFEHSADDLWWLKLCPISLRRRLAELLCTVGASRVGTRAWNYVEVTQRR